MEFIVENWYVIVTGIVFIVGGVMAARVGATCPPTRSTSRFVDGFCRLFLALSASSVPVRAN